jgi:phosphoglycolate phosphatase
MYRNLIFDWSGTLVDDLGPVLDATNAVFASYGRGPIDREEFRMHFRLPYSEFYQEFLPGVSIPELEDRFRPAFHQSTAEVFVLPHAREKLEWCSSRGIRCFVLSSMHEEAFQAQLNEFGLASYFEATYAGVPDKRDLIHEIIDRHQLHPAETAFVGDMIHDIETARHGGIASIAVLTGYTHGNVLAASSPDITVADLDALMKVLDQGNLSSSNV